MSSWTRAYERHGSEVLAFLTRRLWGRREEAEDLCQETFARVLARGAELKDAAMQRAYLLRTANNLLLNHLRRPRLVTAESDLGAEADLAELPDARGRDTSAEVELNELQAAVGGLLAELHENQRRAFELGALERRPYAEVARILGLSEAAVKINVYRARRHLINGLRDHVEADPDERDAP